jgi:hypothetical protein
MKHTSILLHFGVAQCVLSSFILFSCTAATQTASPKEFVTVYATSAAQPWLTELYACSEELPVVLNVNADEADIYLRVGEPENIISPVYQIDEEEILIVTHRESPVQNLSLAEAQNLFMQENPSLQVWVYSSDADVQILFDQLVMKGRSVTSSAKVAVNAQNMSDLLNSESNAVGILPRHWKAGSVREVYSVGTVPVLAITSEEPQGTVIELIACLQSN